MTWGFTTEIADEWEPVADDFNRMLREAAAAESGCTCWRFPPTGVEPCPSHGEGNLAYLREKYAVGFITHDELEEGLESVLRGGPINVPKGKGTVPV